MKVASTGLVYVKATRFLQPSSVMVDEDGIRHDRMFALLEADGKFVNSDQHRTFMPLRFDYDAASERLSLELPDGEQVDGPAAGDGVPLQVDHFGLREIGLQKVAGPWQQALSDFAGRPISLVRCLSRLRAIDVFPVTVVTTGALARLAREVGEPVDPARFRAGFIIEANEEHAEDGWDGKHLRLGEVLLRIRTSVPRCAVTGFNPGSGARDQDVMRALIRYRDKVTLPDNLMPSYSTPGFASYAEVLEPGRVAVGDPVSLAP
jgi:uncharacterized protein YcbX